jgi:hypothetical protein
VTFDRGARDAVGPAAYWRKVKTVLLTHYHKPQIAGARSLFSAVAAHRLKGQPVWPMMVAPPGSIKTELVESLDGVPGVHFVDTVTPHTFISGQIEDHKKPGNQEPKAPASLLHRIGPDGILVCPDFSTVISMNADHRGSVLADLRRIYDGRLCKEFGTAEKLQERKWEGRITFIAAATPDVDMHYAIFTTLGERFVMVRWHRPGGIEAALKAMNQDRQAAKQALREAVHGLLKSIGAVEPELPRKIQKQIAALSEFAVRARTHVPRDGYRKDIIYVPEPEASTRLSQELAQLVKGSALLSGRSCATQKDYAVARRAGFDCIPAMRAKVLEILIAGGDISSVDMPRSTKSYAVQDLRCQELLAENGLSPLAVELLRKARVV